MAAIDKTYADNYTEYKEFLDWAQGREIEFFDGHREKVIDYIAEYEKEDFDGSELVVMNSPHWFDVYLIQNCPVKFIQDRMKEVYSRNYEELRNKDFPSKLPSGYKRGRNIKIEPTDRTEFRIHDKPWIVNTWWLQNEDPDWDFNTHTNKWVSSKMLYPHNSNTSHHGSIRQLRKFIKKQYLPAGLEFRLIGGYVGEEYKVVIL